MCTPGKLSQSSKAVITRAYFQKELLCFREKHGSWVSEKDERARAFLL